MTEVAAHGWVTLFYKELLRFWKVAFQTIAAPILTSLLYLLIFSHVLEGRVSVYDGRVNYTAFLVPGLVMMSVLQNSFANSSSSLIQSKITGNLIFVLLPPLSALDLFAAYVLGAMVRGIVVGLGVFIVTLLFAPSLLSMPHPGWALLFALAGSAILAMLGLLAGLWADKFDQLAAFQNFIIVPLTFLSGVFYSIHSLPPFWQTLSHFNPFFYMIDGFRYGFFGVSDVSPFGEPRDRRRRRAGARRRDAAAARQRLEAAALEVTMHNEPPVTPDSIRQSLVAGLACDHVEVRGDGHHFEAIIVSPPFAGLSRVKQHQLVYAALGDRMRAGDPRAVDADADPRAMGGERTWISSRSKAGPLSGEVRVSGAKNAALPILCAALLTPEPLTLTNVPRLNDVRTMETLLAQMGVALDTRTPGTVTLDPARHRLAARAVRARQDDARVDPRARPAARALRRGARVAARRMRDRPAPGRPARQGPAGDGRRDRPRARLHQRHRAG